MPPEVGAVYEYTFESDKTPGIPHVILTLASWRDGDKDMAIFAALDLRHKGWWNGVWHLNLTEWNKAWRKRA